MRAGKTICSRARPDHVAVVRAPAGLDDAHRQVIVLRYLADLGTAHIAHELDEREKSGHV
jgi:DNA-directed RNA polymerase specialized sigma24 family protein